MNLRLKMLVVYSAFFAVISLPILGYSNYLLTHNYEDLETKQVRHSLQQSEQALNDMLDSLKQHNADWAQWDNTYQFMLDKNNNYIKTNFTEPSFKNISVNLMLFFKPDGKPWYALNYSNQNNAFIPPPSKLIPALLNEKSYLFQPEHSKGKAGFLAIDGRLIALSALPVLNSEAKGPSHGTMIMGHYLTDEDFAKLSSLLNLRLTITPLPIQSNDPLIQNALNRLNQNESQVVLPLNNKMISGFTYLKNNYQTPIALLTIQMPREISLQARQIIIRYIAILLLVGFILMLSIWYLLKILILDKMVTLNQQIDEIKTTGQFTQRILEYGSDEIGQLGKNLNDLLEIIELTQGRLNYRLTLRKEELARLAALNKELYNNIAQETETERKLLDSEKILKQLAYYDPLTGLPNRLFFKEIVSKLILKAERDGSGLAILMLDANGFKQINNLHGDIAGEQFLKETAIRLKDATQPADVIARVAGDEFILCLTQIRSKDALTKMLTPLLARLAEPHTLENLPLHSTFSVGISLYPNDSDTFLQLEQHAETALRYAEKQKKTAFVFFDELQNNEFHTLA